MNRTGMSPYGALVTRSAMGLALALGMVSSAAFVSSPALAAKKQKDQGPQLKLSPAFRKAIVNADAAIRKNDFEAARTAMTEAKQAIESNDDRYQYHAIELNLGIGLKDQDMQFSALRGMLDTGLVPEAQIGQFSTFAASDAYEKKEYDAAIGYARKAEAIGYKPEQVYPIMAQSLWGKAGKGNLSEEPARSLVIEGLTNFKRGIDAMNAAGQPVPIQWYQVAIGKADGAALPQLRDWAQWAFDAEPSGENLRTILRVFQRDNPTMSNRENLDLLRLMYWSGGLALAADYSEYAEMAGKSGIYGEVKSVIDEGKSSGIISGGGGGDYYTTASEQIAGDKASLPSAEADARKAATGKIAAATGAAYLGYEDYTKAIAMYQLALEKGGVDADEVNTHIGIARAKSGDSAGAMEAFGKVQGAIRGQLAKYWADYVKRRNAASTAAAPATASSAQ
jgi:hypothetical protein